MRELKDKLGASRHFRALVRRQHQDDYGRTVRHVDLNLWCRL